MTEKEFLEYYGRGIASFINLYERYKGKYKSDENRPNNNIFSILNESVLRECIANKFIKNSNNYKITVEAFYEKKDDKEKRKKLDLLIWKDDKMLYALELKIERDNTTTSSGIREMISDAHRLIIDKENNYRKKIKDAQKYTVLLVDPKYIVEKSGYIWGREFYETLLKSLDKNEDEEVDCNEICKKIEEIVSKKSNNKSRNKKGEDKKNDDTEKWLDCSEKMKDIKLTVKRKLTIDDSNNIKIILFKCEKKETDNQEKDDTSNS